jgi:hypothetical protein
VLLSQCVLPPMNAQLNDTQGGGQDRGTGGHIGLSRRQPRVMRHNRFNAVSGTKRASVTPYSRPSDRSSARGIQRSDDVESDETRSMLGSVMNSVTRVFGGLWGLNSKTAQVAQPADTIVVDGGSTNDSEDL